MAYVARKTLDKMTKKPITPGDIRAIEDRLVDFQLTLRDMRKRLEQADSASVVVQFQTLGYLCDRLQETITKVDGYMNAALLAHELRKKHRPSGD